jgi:hypothetical protein
MNNITGAMKLRISFKFEQAVAARHRRFPAQEFFGPKTAEAGEDSPTRQFNSRWASNAFAFSRCQVNIIFMQA